MSEYVVTDFLANVYSSSSKLCSSMCVRVRVCVCICVRAPAPVHVCVCVLCSVHACVRTIIRPLIIIIILFGFSSWLEPPAAGAALVRDIAVAVVVTCLLLLC